MHVDADCIQAGGGLTFVGIYLRIATVVKLEGSRFQTSPATTPSRDFIPTQNTFSSEAIETMHFRTPPSRRSTRKTD